MNELRSFPCRRITRPRRPARPAPPPEPDRFPRHKLPSLLSAWLMDLDIAGCTAKTLTLRRVVVANLLWFLDDNAHTHVGPAELKAFLLYLREGHADPRGRWGKPNLNRPTSPSTFETYHRVLHALFEYAVKEEWLPASPMNRVPKPQERETLILPFAREEVASLLAAARKSRWPARDVALVCLLLDTGVRATECCNLRWRDVDMDGEEPALRVVQGKGKKDRHVPLHPKTVRRLALYAREREDAPEEDDAVFVSSKTGEGMDSDGLRRIILRLGKRAQIALKRCSPHTFRHTMAVMYLMSGGDIYSLKAILGHRSLRTLQIYLTLAEANVSAKHRKHSPMNDKAFR